MVEIQEITDNDDPNVATEKKKTKETTTQEQDEQLPPPPKGMKYRKTKKDLPSVGYLLAHGSPESQGRPKTFCDIFGYPIFIAVCFAISLLIFHYAPHDKSVQPRGKYSLPKQKPRRQTVMVPETTQVPPKTVEEEDKLDDMVQQQSPPENTGTEGEL